MAAPRCPFPSLLLLALLALSAPALPPADAGGREPSKTYIFRVDHRAKPSVFPTHAHWYASAAFASSGSGFAPLEPLHVYGTVFHGFFASVPAARAEELRRHPAVLAAFEDRVRPLHTTRPPQFTGLRARLGLWSLTDYGSDVVVGVLDTGVWPERHSLSDRNLPPVPSWSRGGCDAGPWFPKSSCNRKLVGARFFSQGHGARRRGRRVQRVRGVHVPPRRRRARDAHGHHRRGERRVRGEHAGVRARGRQGRRTQGQGRSVQGVLEGRRLHGLRHPRRLRPRRGRRRRRHLRLDWRRRRRDGAVLPRPDRHRRVRLNPALEAELPRRRADEVVVLSRKPSGSPIRPRRR